MKLDDVLAHIAVTFPTGEPFVDVLRTDWDVRVMMAHPVSELGEHWSPPVEAEECMDALHTLKVDQSEVCKGRPGPAGIVPIPS